MERLDREIRVELSRFGPQARDARDSRRLARGRRRDGRGERLAGPDRARRDAAREHLLFVVGVRARPARAGDARQAPRGSRQGCAESAEIRPRPPARAAPSTRRPRPAPRRRSRARKPCNEPPSSPRRSRTRTCGKLCKERSLSAWRRARPTSVSDTLNAARKALICRAFSYDGSCLLGKGHHCPRRTRPGPETARACTSARLGPEASTIWPTKSSTTRSTRRSRAATTTSRCVIHPDKSMTVTDNGSGIPVDMMKTRACPRSRSC